MTTATKAKIVNYTPEQTTVMVSDFLAGMTVEAIAEKMGKSVRSVISKLSREKTEDGKQVRTAKAYVNKTGGAARVKKDVTADAIGAVLSLTENEIESLTKANSTALTKIFAALANSKPLDGAA